MDQRALCQQDRVQGEDDEPVEDPLRQRRLLTSLEDSLPSPL